MALAAFCRMGHAEKLSLQKLGVVDLHTLFTAHWGGRITSFYDRRLLRFGEDHRKIPKILMKFQRYKKDFAWNFPKIPKILTRFLRF